MWVNISASRLNDVEGLTSKEIAQHLGIGYRTVEIHRAHIMHKTGASSLLELARISYASECASNIARNAQPG
jgi:FixJ family two-component response regulator